RVVLAAVIDEENVIDAAGWEIGERGGECSPGVIRRQHGDHLVRTLRERMNRLEDPIDVKDVVGRLERWFGEKGGRHALGLWKDQLLRQSYGPSAFNPLGGFAEVF